MLPRSCLQNINIFTISFFWGSIPSFGSHCLSIGTQCQCSKGKTKKNILTLAEARVGLEKKEIVHWKFEIFAHSKIYQIINIFTMMFVYHYVIIPFHLQYLPRHAPSNIAKWRERRWREPWPKTAQFPLLKYVIKSFSTQVVVDWTSKYKAKQ